MDTKLKKFSWIGFIITNITLFVPVILLCNIGIPWTKHLASLQVESVDFSNPNIPFSYNYYLRIFQGELFSTIFLLSLAGICIIGFLTALKPSWRIGRGLFSKIPLELYVFAGIFAPTFLIEATLWELIPSMVYDGTEILYDLFFLSPEVSNFIVYFLIGLVLWTWGLFAFQVSAILGAGLRDGFLNYLKQRSITFFLVRKLAKVSKKSIVALKKASQPLTKINLSSPVERTLIRLIALNSVLVFMICFGIFPFIIDPVILIVAAFFVIVYSVVLFVLLYKKASTLKNAYDTLLDTTQQMALGNLNQPIQEDCNLLNPLRDSINAVQKGFSKAVNEEVRSRNMKTELITNVSHDLKTPLTSITTYIDLLKNPDLEEDTRIEYLNILDKKSQRLKHLIEDLFEVSKAATGDVTLHFDWLDLSDLLRQVQCETQDITESCGVDFRWNIPQQKVFVLLDGMRSSRIFENLVNNITKYAMKGSRAYINLEIEKDWALVSFKNISAQEITDSALLTERFVRGDSSRSTEGSGLGLAIAKSFTELQQGQFILETESDLFKVWVKFPLAQEIIE